MHEFSIALQIVRHVETAAEQHEARQVRAVRIRVGALSGVVGAALQSAWAIARDEGVCATASLEIEDVPVRLSCPTCGCVEAEDIACRLCPQCGNAECVLLSGQELELDSIVVDEPDAQTVQTRSNSGAAPVEVV